MQYGGMSHPAYPLPALLPPACAAAGVDRRYRYRTMPAWAALGRLVLVLLIAAWSAASTATELERDFVGPRFDVLSISLDLAHGGNQKRRSGLYKISASVVLTPAQDDARNDWMNRGAIPESASTEPKSTYDGPLLNVLRFVPVSNRPSLSPLLSFDSKEHKLNLRLRRHGFWLQYRRDFH